MANALEFSVLTDEQIQDALIDLPEWERDGVKIRKTYVYPTFRDAIAFVNRVADVAEKFNHHPLIDVNFKKVMITLWTHKCHAITKADMVLAAEIEKVMIE
jgi:4a-hydroxytetrahydrobiopterin dehydratase